jgi:hypothetical protein
MPNGLGFNSYAARYMSGVVGVGGATPNHLVQQAIERLSVDMHKHLGANAAVWPIYGGTAGSHALNLFGITAYNLYYTGNPTHSSTGMTPVSPTDYAASTFNVKTGLISQSNFSFGVYSRTSSNNDNYWDVGTYSATGQMRINARNVAGNVLAYSGNATLLSTAVGASTGLFAVHRVSANDAWIYRNGTAAISTAVAVESLPNQTWGAVGAVAGDGTSSRQIAFSFVGRDVTDRLTFYNDIQAFQTSLGRQV